MAALDRGINAPGKPVAPTGSVRWCGKNNEVFIKVDAPSPYAGRERVSRGRSFVTHAESGCYRSRRLVNWEAVHGPAPKGCIVRRLLPICDCESNLVLVTRSVNARLNQGSWVRPAKPWRSLPPDHDIRLAAVMAAVAQVVSTERRRA